MKNTRKEPSFRKGWRRFAPWGRWSWAADTDATMTSAYDDQETSMESNNVAEVEKVRRPQRRQTVSSPYGIKHDLHVQYNYQEARFEGIPSFWKVFVSRQFGVEYFHIPRYQVDGYDDRIPAVLHMLQQQLFAKNGHELPYIFRTSPSKSKRDEAIAQINSGNFTGEVEPTVVADLLKVWFRELPTPILKNLRPEVMTQIATQGPESVSTLLQGEISSLERSILYWLADTLVQVAQHEEANHMGLEQLAIVVAPNLIKIDSDNPMYIVTFSKTNVDFLKTVLQYRKQWAEDQLRASQETLELQEQENQNPVNEQAQLEDKTSKAHSLAVPPEMVL